MKSKKILLAMLAFALVLGMAVIGCGGNTPPKEEIVPGPPAGSVDNYARLEPVMTANPNRAVARVGGTTVIGIPEQLRSASRAATATFTIATGDTRYAQIISYTSTTCTIQGLSLGSVRVIVTVGEVEATVVVAVPPTESYSELPQNQEIVLRDSSLYSSWRNSPYELPNDFANYRAEPTYQLAWNWRNPTDYYGASDTNCGIDILAYYVDPNDSSKQGWVKTTYGFGGWFYDLNGVTDKMVNGFQKNGDLELQLIPEFIYDNGVPYLQITHSLTNKGTTALTGVKFGASVDVMIFRNDYAPLTSLAYGALMTDSESSPTLKLRLICLDQDNVLQGRITPVDTLWLGRWSSGSHRSHIYEDARQPVTGYDSALNFSYKDINLPAGQSKTYKIRFTQVQ